MHHYRPQTKFAKIIFLHVSVFLFTGGGGLQANTQGGGWGVWRGGGGVGLQAHTRGDVSQHALR